MKLPVRPCRRVRSSIRVLTAAVLSGAGSLPAAPGDFDLSLGGTGVVINSSVGVEGVVQAAVIQPDGKIVVAGYSKPVMLSQIGLFVARFLPDGNLDPSFGSGAGFVRTTFVENNTALAVALQPDGKIVTVGSLQGFHPNPATLLLTRFMPDGGMDNTFNGTGFVMAPAVEWFTAGAVAIQSDGRILVAGGTGPGLYSKHFTVARFLPNGLPDASFNGSGKVVTAMGDVSDEIHAMALQKDGKIVVAGTSESVAPAGSTGTQTSQFAVARYLPNGALDTGFNGSGKFLAGQALEFNAKGLCVAVQNDGKIVVGGKAWPNVALMRLDAQGQPDLTFNGTGQGTYPVGVRPVISSLLVDGIGRIVAVGGPQEEESTGPALVMQVLPNGQLDTTFRGTGFLTSNLGGTGGVFFAAAREKGGTLLAAGGSPKGRPKVALARFQMAAGVALENPAGTPLTNSSTEVLDFGPVASGTTFRLFTVRNTEAVPLTGLTVSLSGMSNPGEFAVIPPATDTLPVDGSTTFSIAFTPSAAPGPHTATLLARGTAGAEHTFSISLTGRRATPSEVWRYTWFASYENSGTAADLYDFDGDGLENLLEFALGGHPHQTTLPDAGLVRNGEVLEYTYRRSVASLTDVTHQPEFGATPAGPWSAEGITGTVVSDDGVMQTVKAVVPVPAERSAGFVRLKVSRR